LEILAQGGIVAHATETCYGLACDLTNPKAVEKLFQIKERAFDQPVSALFPTIEEAKKFVEWNDEAEKLAREFLPGPLTLILPLLKTAPTLFVQLITNNQQPTNSTIGIRVSSHPLATELALRFGKPISTTSANIHGQPNTYSAEEIVTQFEGKVVQPDLLIDSGVLPKIPPSKVIVVGTNIILRK